MTAHWEIYLSRDRASGNTPWTIVAHGKNKMHAQYAETIVMKVQSYTGLASHRDRPQYVVHCYGFLRRSGSVIYIEDAKEHG